jgi:hypothetical protein
MRRVAHAAELVDLMLDAAYAQMPRTDTTGQPWQQRVTAIAEENRALFEAHPWTATVSTTRPPLGLVAKYEHELSALDGLGLDDVEMDAALTYLLSFVQSCARDATAVRISQQDSAMTTSNGGQPTRRCSSESSTPRLIRLRPRGCRGRRRIWQCVQP